VIAATNAKLSTLVEGGAFRADLLYRIDTFRIVLPPLRERLEDLPLLAAHFLARAPLAGRPRAPAMSPEAMRRLFAYGWPGNVRELEHAIEQAVLVADGASIELKDLPERIIGLPAEGDDAASVAGVGDFRSAGERFERDYFRGLLAESDGNIAAAAKIAGLHRATLYSKLKRLGLVRDEI